MIKHYLKVKDDEEVAIFEEPGFDSAYESERSVLILPSPVTRLNAMQMVYELRNIGIKGWVLESHSVFEKRENIELALVFLDKKADILACSANYNTIQDSSLYTQAVVIDPIINPKILFQSLPSYLDQKLLLTCLSHRTKPLTKSKEEELALFINESNANSISELIGKDIPPPLDLSKSFFSYLTSSAFDFSIKSSKNPLFYEKSFFKLDLLPPREKILANIFKSIENIIKS